MSKRNQQRLNTIHSQLFVFHYRDELNAVMKVFELATWKERDRLLVDINSACERGSYTGVPLGTILGELHYKHPLYVMFRPNIRLGHTGFKALMLWTFLVLLAVFGEKGINRAGPVIKPFASIALAVGTYMGIIYFMYILVILVNGNLFNH